MAPRANQRRETSAHGGLGIDQIPSDAQVAVDSLTGDEEPHDLTGPFENHVDARVAEAALQRERILAALTQRVCSLVSSASPDLNRVVSHFEAGLAVPHLRDGRFETYVEGLGIGHESGEFDYRIEREGVGSHLAEHLCYRSVFADRRSPLEALGGPLAAHE